MPELCCHSKAVSSCHRLAREKDGVTSIEFAFVAPTILLLMMGTLEFSLIAFTTSIMEGATNTTARLGKTGYIAKGSSREDQLIENIQRMTAGLLQPTGLTVTTTVYPLFDNIGAAEPYTDTNGNHMYNVGEPYSDINGNGQWDADMGIGGAGDANDVVVYKISYDWPIFTPIINVFLGNMHTITTRTVIKNEPYNVQI